MQVVLIYYTLHIYTFYNVKTFQIAISKEMVEKMPKTGQFGHLRPPSSKPLPARTQCDVHARVSTGPITRHTTVAFLEDLYLQLADLRTDLKTRERLIYSSAVSVKYQV